MMDELFKTKRYEVLGWLLILTVFSSRIADALYIRNHGDAMNYHLYAPLMWARYGLDYVSGFQVMQYQSGLFEMFLTFLFRLNPPESLGARELWHIAIQTLSSTVAFLVLPTILLLKSGLTKRESLLVVCLYVAMTPLTWTSNFAKNDAVASCLFVCGFLSPARSWRQILLLALAVGVKQTYIYGAFLIAVLNFRWSRDFWRQGFILLGPLPIWIRNFVNTGNPTFPIPSAKGLQISQWQKDYFADFTNGFDPVAFFPKFKFFLEAPAAGLALFLFVLALWMDRKAKFDSKRVQGLLIGFLPLLYFFVTGPKLEPRTYAGIFIVASLLWVRTASRLTVHSSLFGVLFFLSLLSSKIDFSSWNRWSEAKHQTYSQRINYGSQIQWMNERSKPGDLVITLLSNEGWYLKPVLLTLNEHSRREELRAAFPMLEDIQNFVLLRNQNCAWTGEAKDLVNQLLAGASSVQATPHPQVFELTVKCEPPSGQSRAR